MVLSSRRVVTWSALMLTAATLVALGFAEQRQFSLGPPLPPDFKAKSHLFANVVYLPTFAFVVAGLVWDLLRER